MTAETGARRDDAVYRQLFEALYGRLLPQLGDIIHWRAAIDDLGLSDLSLNRATAYLPSGYFVRTHTRAPDAAHVTAALREAADNGAVWTLYPCVRDHDDTRALAAAGFTRLPWFIEAEYRVRDGLDADLRAQLGPRRHRELLRLVRRADEQFDTTVVGGQQNPIRAESVDAFDRLHRLNIAKYGHGVNHFSAAIVGLLLNSPLAPRLRLFQRHPRRGGEAIQAVLALVDERRSAAHLLVHGIDHARVPPGQNLYATSLYGIFRWGLGRGITTFNLGRGADEVKLNLGANAFHPLANHLAATHRYRTGRDSELARLEHETRRRLDLGWDRLREIVKRRGATGRVQFLAGETEVA